MDTAVIVFIVAGVVTLLALAYLLLTRGSGAPGPQGPEGPAGPVGPEGPTVISSDPGNYAELGSDSFIFVPAPTGGGGGDPERPPDIFYLTDFGGDPWNENFDNSDAIERMFDAASHGGKFILPGAFWISRPVVPRHDSIIESIRAPKYAWHSDEVGAGLIARSDFNGPALVWNRDMARAVTMRHLGLFGPAEGGEVDGIDFGAASGPERNWIVENSQIMYCGVGLTGFLWVVQARGNQISRNGWAIAPHLANTGQNCRTNDCLITDNYIYFNRDGGIWLGGDTESGLTTIAHGRIERSGVSMDPMNPNVNRVENAPGILLTRATAITIDKVSTDANAGPGFVADAVENGRVNNLDLSGTFKRDGTYKNVAGERMPGVVLRGVHHSTLNGPLITFGDPDDKGSGVVSPQIGYRLDTCEFIDGHARVQLQNNSATATYGVELLNNWEMTATFSGWG